MTTFFGRFGSPSDVFPNEQCQKCVNTLTKDNKNHTSQELRGYFFSDLVNGTYQIAGQILNTSYMASSLFFININTKTSLYQSAIT